MSDELALDHASLRVPDLDRALAFFDRIGLNVTRTPAARERHSRLYLDRNYVEVASAPDMRGDTWELPLFFMRFGNRDETLARLRQRGLRVEPAEYSGVDGHWEEIKISSDIAVPLPILVRRTEPVEVAANWPPPLSTPHPIGAVGLHSVVLTADRVGDAHRLFQTLLGSQPTAAEDEIVIGQASGVARIAGLTLRVASIRDAIAFLDGRKVAWTREGRHGVWLEPDHTFGIHLGFNERPA